MSLLHFLCYRFLSVSLVVLSIPVVPVQSDIYSQDLTITRSIAEKDWLNLKLELLGLRLSYPAYRIFINLNEENAVSFEFFLSSSLAQHLEDAGRGEAERVLSYHAEGILNKVIALLREDFPELWPGFDSRSDFRGLFLRPGEEFDSLPQEVGMWQADRLKWKD